MPMKKMTRTNIMLLLLVVLIAATSLFIAKGSEFGGADGQAENAIAEINPNYKPWFSSLYEPPSSEIESMLFALQAALGAGFIGYYLGLKHGKLNKAED